jgi:twitching motility protein PilT
LSLRYIVCQHLLPSSQANERRALGIEVLASTSSVRAAVRDGKIDSIDTAIQIGRREGMISFDMSLARLAATKRISWDTARQYAKDSGTMEDYLSSGGMI